MAVQSDTSRISYTGNNSTSTSYAVPFYFLENSHLSAIAKVTATGVETVVTLTNHTGAGDQNGGTVRTAVAVPATSTLTISRTVPATQTTTYQEGGDFPAASHERGLDKLTMLGQQIARSIARTVRLSDAAPESSPLPALPNRFFGTDNTGAIALVTGTDAPAGSLTDSNIATDAAIALSKLATGALPTGITVASANLVDGTIVDADINAAAAIAYGKLDLNDSIVTGDLTDDAVTTAKIDDEAVTTAKIDDGAVTAAKLNGAQTGSAPIYGCRAWVNFDGNFTAVTGNNYSRTGTTVVVTKTAHGLQSGNRLVIASATDTGLNTAANTASAEITFIDVNSFSFQTNSTGTATGTLTYARGIRQSGNIASVVRNGASADYTLTFATAMPNTSYAVYGTSMATGTATSATIVYELDAANRTTSSCRIAVGDNQLDAFLIPSFGVSVQIVA